MLPDFLSHIPSGAAYAVVALAVLAESLMTRHGDRAVFVARFLPVVRTLAPHFAGASRLPYHRIAPCSASAACLWATVESGIGYGAATGLHEAVDGPVLTAAALVALGGGLLWVRSRRRAVQR